MTPDRTKAARELLAFYLEAGADALLTEEPADRFADREPIAAPPRPPLSVPAAKVRPDAGRAAAPPLAAPLAPDAAAGDARALARKAASLEELRGLLQGFDGCELKRHAKQLVFADGNPQARVMFVGEAPGRDEDQEGLPFVGRSGKLLDRMMKAIGLDRTSSYIANVIPWRPPGNRTPTPQETQICLPFIQRQIELVDPDVLVCLGGPSSQTLLGFTDGIMRTRGRWLAFDTGTREIRAVATLHPAYLLRQPLHKRLAWRDFLAIRKALAK
ncbi:MAG TPA: uracil-DNA glycosylase [Xanthobacteraceae bacterium]|nr:uracil-DNA glycosylase [Xanthobacteraceae bacterium]